MNIPVAFMAAAAFSPVSGDFDNDGLVDRAYVRKSEMVYELAIDRGSGETVVVHTMLNLTYFYLSELEPGTYRTACAKGFGRSDIPCPERTVTLDRYALQFGMEEASQAAVFWDRGRFRVVWLSD